jgi:hypothetical protein
MSKFVRIGDSTITNDVAENLISYFDYNLLSNGNYHEASGSLVAASDPRYTDRSVWYLPNKNIVWESGMAPVMSGVLINNVFHATSSSQYPHYTDYINGKVVFNSAIPASKVVSANYAYKAVEVCRVDGLNWFQRIDVDGTGLLRENLVKPPAIGFEHIRKNLSPYQLGGGQTISLEFLVHCVDSDSYIRDTLADIVSYQKDVRFRMYNLNSIADGNAFPIDYRGVPNSGALNFPQLQSQYPGRLLDIMNVSTDSVYTIGGVHVTTLKLTVEVVHLGV